MVSERKQNSKNELNLKKTYHFLGKDYNDLSELFSDMVKSQNYQAAIEEWKKGEIVNQVKEQMDGSPSRDSFNTILNLEQPRDEDDNKHVKVKLGLVYALLNPQAGFLIDGNEVTPENLKGYIDYFFHLKEKTDEDGKKGKKFLMTSQVVQILEEILGSSPLVNKLRSLDDLVHRYSTVLTEYQLFIGRTVDDLGKNFIDIGEARLDQMKWAVDTSVDLNKLAESKKLIPDKGRVVQNITKFEPNMNFGNIDTQLQEFKKKYHGGKGDWASLYDKSELSPMETLLLLSAPEEFLFFNRKHQVWKLAGISFLIVVGIVGLIVLPYLFIENKEGKKEDSISLHQIGSDGLDVAKSTQLTFDNELLIAGNTTGFGKGRNDFLAVKVRKDGQLEWSTTVGGAGDDIVNVMSLSQDSGFYLGGMTVSLDQNSMNSLLVKLDSRGIVVWNRLFDVGGEDEIIGLTELSWGSMNKGIAITGRFSQENENRVYTAILDSDGKLVWYQKFDEASNGYGVAAIEGENQEIVFFGNHQGRSGQRDLVIFAMSLDQEMLWRKQYRNLNVANQKWVLPVSDGILLAGEGLDSTNNTHYVDAIKIDYDGHHLWDRRLVDTGVSRPISLSAVKNENPKENYLVVTETIMSDQSSYNLLHFFDEDGDYTQKKWESDSTLAMENAVWGMFESGKLILIGDDNMGADRLQDIWVMNVELSTP